MVQHTFAGDGPPEGITPNNPGDHYSDNSSYPPKLYIAAGVLPDDLEWMRIPALSSSESYTGGSFYPAARISPSGYLQNPLEEWQEIATLDSSNGSPGTPVRGRLWVTEGSSIQQGVGVGTGDKFKMLATIEVDDTDPTGPDGREPGIYLNNQTGAVFICDGLGTWFQFSATAVS